MMEIDAKLFDHYSLRARLQPALLASMPLVVGAVAWLKLSAWWPSAIWGLFVTAGFTFFLANVARNRGKALEPTLWSIWGGAPTTQLLRHSGPANPVMRERWHKQLAKILGKKLPTKEQELKDGAQADAIYEAGVRLLIGKTRDVKAYPLVYGENVSYGFCRNLFGLKSIGISVSLFGLAASIASGLALGLSVTDLLPWICATICLFQLLWWIFIVRADWVKVPAMNYAQHLLESAEKASAKS
jgi:hypothetical protein